MSRFIARYGKYSHGIRSEVAEQFAQGTRVIVRGLEAKFDTRGVTEYEKELALKNLSFHGQLEDRIEGGKVSPVSRISVFDSRATQEHLEWTDEEHDLVVEKLRKSPMNGVEFFEAEEPRRPAPWNGYDELEDVDRILTAVEVTGVDPAGVIAYERENADREEVIEALEDLVGNDETEPDVTINAS